MGFRMLELMAYQGVLGQIQKAYGEGQKVQPPNGKGPWTTVENTISEAGEKKAV